MVGLEYVLKLWNMQQDELAERLGIKKQNINYWVTGKRNIPKKYLPKLVEMFNIPEKYFQKELTYVEKEKIQFMKLYKTNDLESLGFDFYEEYNPTPEEEEIENETTKQKLTLYNKRRKKVFKIMQEKLDLKVENQQYSIQALEHMLNHNELALGLIEKFINILVDCDRSNQMLFEELLTVMELYQGKKLPEKYNSNNKIIEEFVNVMTIVDPKSINFIDKVLEITKEEGRRIIDKRKKYL